MNCNDCKFAQWVKTKNGRMHPNKTGKCSYIIKPLVTPYAFYFIGGSPRLGGGFIDRDEDHRQECITYEKKEVVT